TWKLDRLGEDISKELEERFRPPRAYISNKKKRKAGEYENRSKQRRYLPPPPQKNQNTRSLPIPVGSNSQQSFEKSRRNPTSAADPTQKLAKPVAPEEAATTSNLPRTPGIGFADGRGNFEKQRTAEDSENSQTNGIECFSQPLNMTQFHQPGASSRDTASAASQMARLGVLANAGAYSRSDAQASNLPQMSLSLPNLQIPDAGLTASSSTNIWAHSGSSINNCSIPSRNSVSSGTCQPVLRGADRPQAAPDFNRMNIDSYNNAYQAHPRTHMQQAPQPAADPAALTAHFESTPEPFFHPVAFTSFIGTDPMIQSSQPAADTAALTAHFESTPEPFFHPVAFTSFIGTDPMIQSSQPAADPAALTAHFELTPEPFFHPTSFTHFINTSSMTAPMQPPQLREDLVRT
ncbi:hypothetical protein ACJ73_10288, partial [Blastomyces percursus]